MLVHHFRWKLHDGLSILHHLGDEARTHHRSIVGKGIVEGQGGNRRNLRLISDTHPWQCRLAPVVVLTMTVLVRHTYSCWCRSHQRYLQVVGESQAMDALYKLLRVVLVMVVDDTADTDVGTIPEGLCEGQESISAFAPVVVFHVPAVHLPYTAARFHMQGGIYDSIVQSHQQGGWLEHGTWLQQVAHGVVVYLSILSVEAFLHVDDRLDVARLDFHDDGDTHVAIDFLQLVDDRTLCQVLHAHVEGRDDVGTVDRRGVGDVQELIAHLSAVYNTIGASQDRVV